MQQQQQNATPPPGEIYRVPHPTYADQVELGLDIEGILERVVDAAETSALAATESSAEAEEEDGLVVVDLEELGDLALKLGLGDVRAVGVKNIHNLVCVRKIRSEKKILF